MKVTNTSAVVQKVRGVEGVVEIRPGHSRPMEFTDDGLERARQRTDLKIESEVQPAQSAPARVSKQKAPKED